MCQRRGADNDECAQPEAVAPLRLRASVMAQARARARPAYFQDTAYQAVPSPFHSGLALRVSYSFLSAV